MLFILKEIVVVLLLSILTAGIAGLLSVAVPRAVSTRYDFSRLKPLAIIGICIVICLGESIFLFGAWRVRRQIDRARSTVEQTIGTATTITQSEFSRLVREYLPQAERYIDTGNQAIGSTGEYAVNYFDTLRRDITRYMGRRIGWMSGFLLAGLVLLGFDADKQRRRSLALASYLQSDYYN